MKKKTAKAIILLIAAFCTVTACGKSSAAEDSTVKTAEENTIEISETEQSSYDTGVITDEQAEKNRAYMQSIAGVNQQIDGDYNKSLARKCSNGTFVGSQDGDVVSFKGIPYAKSPVGELRWKEPEEAASDDGVYEAKYYGASPLQSETKSETGSYYRQSENCLTLNIWENTSNASTDKTVMVFIHGGSYGWGATSDRMYDGTNFVKKYDDVILVTVEYRLGVMGFIDFSEVPGGEAYASSGNLGLLDQICALKWIQKNIAAFGGNPDNVTIFGESAGGGSVSLLPLIDGTEGLFQRVIAESGSVALTFGKDECQEQTQQLLELSGCTNMDELLTLSEDELKSIVDKMTVNDYPERDGVILSEELYDEYADGKAKEVDLLIGTTSDEYRYWINETAYSNDTTDGYSIYKEEVPETVQEIIDCLPEADQQYANDFMNLQTDEAVWNATEFINELIFRIPAVKMAEGHADNGGNTYLYYWSYPTAYKLLGACHACELAYVFNNTDNTIYNGDNIDLELADTVQNMWVNFARTGNPSTENIEWAQYNCPSRMTMVLDSSCHMESDLKSDQRKLIEPLLKYKIVG